MPARTASSQRTVEVDGTELAADIEGQLESVLVVDRLAMPDMFVLVFRDPNRTILGDAGLEIGSKVVISTTSLSGDTPEVLITGEVTSIETEYDALGTRAVARGYDKSHRLASGRKTATFQNVKYSDVASRIASDAGLSPDVDDSGGTVEHLIQANQSDLDFLYGLARRIGFDCRVDDETLLFKRPVESSGAPGQGDFSSENPTELVWESNLLEFRARMSAVAQVAEVKVRGWDINAKDAVIGQADVTATNADVSMTPAELAAKVDGGTMTVVDHPVGMQEPADELAKARAQQVGSAAFEATAVAVGSPALKAGVAVSVSGIDPALEGKWVISGSRHEFVHGTYRTALEFSGRQDRSILGLVSQGAGGGHERFFGVAIGIVTDNDDPDQLGRVKVKYPWLSDDAESYWARVMAPGAGPDYGIVWLPQVSDEVLVAFDHGDISYPVVLGGLWNGQDTIPFDYGSGLDAGKVTYCGLVSRTGHRIEFIESSSDSKIQLSTQGGVITITLDDSNKELTIETSGKVTVNAQDDVVVKTQGNFKVDAMGVEIKASGQMAIKGATVALN
jgi:phage protein D/phage baseplate assembly protein gpV